MLLPHSHAANRSTEEAPAEDDVLPTSSKASAFAYPPPPSFFAI